MIFLSVFSLFLLAEAKHHDRSNGEHGITMSSQYKTRHIPLIISTWGTEGFINASVNAMKVLRLEGRMKALVTGLATCEENQCDATVGFGGSPDESGETTLDAMVIDAPGMKFGAVADLRRIKYASKVAWAVMNHTKHTLLVGESATNFAKQMGFQEETLTTRNSRRIHEEWILNNCQPNFWRNVVPNPLTSCGTYNASATLMNDHFNFSNKIDQFNHDTLGMVIVDEHNLISAGTSSNGASHKIPGRVGDSPIPGAGAYANEFGGAAATGDGDVMMRFLPSYETVREMSLGTKPIKAARKALQLILKHYPQFQGAIVAANKNGEVGASCANIHKFAFVVADTAFHTVHTIDCYPYIHQKLYDTVVVSYPKQSFP